MSATEAAPLRSTIPARLDGLKWNPFHARMVAGLGGQPARHPFHQVPSQAGVVR